MITEGAPKAGNPSSRLDGRPGSPSVLLFPKGPAGRAERIGDVLKVVGVAEADQRPVEHDGAAVERREVCEESPLRAVVEVRGAPGLPQREDADRSDLLLLQ